MNGALGHDSALVRQTGAGKTWANDIVSFNQWNYWGNITIYMYGTFRQTS